MKSNLKKILILFIGLLIAFSLNNTLIDNNGAQNELNTPEQSAGYGESFIHVDGNWTATASTYGWCYGDGSWNAPYIIENVSIDASSSPTGSGIFINNSLDVYFSIRNCTIYNSGSGVSDAGIKLVNVTNGKIVNNTCSNNGNNGIHLMTDCNNNTIANNIANNNGDAGIYLLNNCYENIISNNTVNNNDYGIVLIGKSSIGCDHNNISNNTAINNGVGIHLSQSDFNTVYGNRLVNNSKITFGSTSGNGIRITYHDWGGRSINNIIENNQILSCRYGIFMYDGVSNKILNNTVNNNTLDGMYIRATNFPCVNNTIKNNTVKYNKQHGIYLTVSTGKTCYNNNITENTINENEGHGIYLYKSDYSNITDNTINENNQHGIYFSNSDNSTIINNTINDNTDIGIRLRSSSDNNILKNNTINRNDIGIALDQSNYNNISGNTLKDNTWCIYETNSVGNIIKYNDCSPPTVQEPIFINAAATGVGAHNWTWAVSHSWCSGSGTWNDPYIIENLKINGLSVANGIEIINSNSFFVIQNCTIYNTVFGIYLDNVNNSRIIKNNCTDSAEDGISLNNGCNNNTISRNTANGNNYAGIYLLDYCDDNILSENTVNNNDQYGIYIEYQCNNNDILGNTANDNGNIGIYMIDTCENNTISNNTVNNNDDGINLEGYCDNNFIGGNTANDNSRTGIYLMDSDYNNITGNTASGSIDGIFLEDQNYNNRITGNNFSNNDYGIEIFYSDFNSIIGNTANDNNYYGITIEGSNNNSLLGNNVINNTIHGVFIHEQSHNNTLSGNRVHDNKDTGIYLDDDCDYTDITENSIYNNSLGIFLYSECGNNSIYKNFFLINGKHAVDNGTDNKWNSTTIGNYWDNHTGPDVSPNDGIVDDPYTFIGGSAGSIDYLPIAEDGAPSITINSPSDDDVFGSIAPSYDVTITDDYLFEMWYTLDGGLHNYTFTEFTGTINQSAWDALSDDPLTLTFYASDIPGNIESDEVNIIRDTQTPTITVNSPEDDDIFSVSAPSFNVSITDDNLDTMWYTLDGGLNNYTFTENDTIHQGAWDALPDGPVEITFYTNDTLGRLASAAVNIIKDTQTPTITVNSPDPGELFDNIAPSFNVRITDDYLDEMWYSLDGGLTTYTITTNATIDQTAWAALSDGLITITFYANDTVGHETSEDIIIVKDATGPIIVINSPVDDEEFGSQAPLFNITITDDHLDSIWYSLDGGVTTYAITTNATIDQTAWAALSEGPITITFYANDTLGNEASKDVIITKTVPEDPTIVIVIVVVSIVGGVAVLAGVYLFMKKRGLAE